MALIVARLIWLRRNNVVFGGVFSAPQGIVAAARKMVEEFSLVLQRPTEMNRGSVSSRDRWSSPPSGFLKINWDAALDPVLQRTGIGIVIRDEGGGFYAKQAKVLMQNFGCETCQLLIGLQSSNYLKRQTLKRLPLSLARQKDRRGFRLRPLRRSKYELNEKELIENFL